MPMDGYNLKGCAAQGGPPLAKPLEAIAQACCCVGPQNGQPVCPCQMRHVKIVDGRYVRIVDLGPAPTKPPKTELRFFGTD